MQENRGVCVSRENQGLCPLPYKPLHSLLLPSDKHTCEQLNGKPWKAALFYEIVLQHRADFAKAEDSFLAEALPATHFNGVF